MGSAKQEKKDKEALDRALNFFKAAYTRAVYSHPSTAGATRQEADANAEEFALLVMRYVQEEKIHVVVPDWAVRSMSRRAESVWDMGQHQGTDHAAEEELSMAELIALEEGKAKAKKKKRKKVKSSA